MGELTTTTRTIAIVTGLKFDFISDVYNGKRLDTKVLINDNYLCTITGAAVDDFIHDFKQLVETYRI